MLYVEENANVQEKAYLDELLALIDKDIATTEPNRYFGGSTLIQFANYLLRNAEERNKQDSDRKAGYQDRDQEGIQNQIKYLNNAFNIRVDKELFLANIKKYRTFDAS